MEATTKNEDDRKESTEPDVEIEGNAQIDQISTSEWIANCVHFNTNDDQENEDEEDEDDQQSDYESTEGRMRWKIEDAENEEDESKQDEESEKENVVEWLKVVTTASNKERGSRHQEANRQSEGDQTKEDPTIMKSVEESDKKEMTRMSSTNERRPLSSSQTSSEKDESTDTIEVKVSIVRTQRRRQSDV